MLHQHVSRIEVQGQIAIIPEWLHKRGWEITKPLLKSPRRGGSGYLKYTGRGAALKRGIKAHRAVMERMIRDTPPERRIGPLFEPNIDLAKWHISHMDFNKLNNAGSNLFISPSSFNPSPSRRNPWTGDFMSTDAYNRLMGIGQINEDDEVPF